MQMQHELSLKAEPDDIESIAPNDSGDSDVDSFKKLRNKMLFGEEKCLYWIRISFLIVSVVATFGIVGIYVWHLVAPLSYRWLLDNDLTKIKDLALTIITGIILSQTTSYFFKKDNKKTMRYSLSTWS